MAYVGACAPAGPLNGHQRAALILPAQRRPSMAGSCLPQRDGTRARPSRGSSEVRGGGILICGKDASRLAPVLSSLRSVLCLTAAPRDAF